jgi:hypothetical protein
MKNIKAFGPWACLMLLLVATLSIACIQRAMAVTVTSSAISYTYNLAAGQSTKLQDVPQDRPVFLMGYCDTLGFRGVGQVVIECEPNSFLQWVGLNSNDSGTITQGFSGTAGTHIVQIDFSGDVNINVADANDFEITNTSGGERSGSIVMLY